MSRRDPSTLAAIAELKAAGVKYEIQQGGKHPAVIWVVGEKERRVTTALSSSDHRAAKNTRARVRRLLRADGLWKGKKNK